MVYFFSVSIFLFLQNQKKEITEIENSGRINKLKTTGEKIKLNFDDCEFKENNYYEEVTHNNVRAEPFVTLFDPNGNREENYIEQSAIIYHHKAGDKIEKFISPPFLMNLEALKVHILDSSVFLYVDRFDRTNYFFDVNAE